MKIERGYAQHVGSRNEQQDAGLVLSDDGRAEQLVLVADGMGGHAGGSLASAQVAETARRIWDEHKQTPIEPKRLLERIIREGHEAINRAGAEKGLTPRSTCVLLYLHNGGAHWAHVGDSRLYRLRDGQVTRLTRDHSVVQMLVDLGKVSEEEMGTHPDQNRLTQSLGGDAVPMPDFGSDGVKEHDAFLICSDGLWEMIPQVEMAAALSAKKLGDDGAKHLADRAFDRAKPKSDNITVALVRMGGPPPASIGAEAEEEARTTRILGQPPLRRSAGGGARWGFAAATVVALGAAAAVVYKPWEKPAAETPATPATAPKVAPPEKAPPPQEKRGEPAKPEPMTPTPAERREAVPPQRPAEPPPPRDQQPAPGATPPPPPAQPATPATPATPGQPAVPDQGSTKPGEPPATGGEPEKRQAVPRPAPARPAQPAPPRQSGLGPDEKKSADPPPNTEKSPGTPVPPAAPPQGPGQVPEAKPQ